MCAERFSNEISILFVELLAFVCCAEWNVARSGIPFIGV